MPPRPALARLLGLLLALLGMLGALTPVARAQTFPALSGRVVDTAHLLTPEQSAAIEAKLADLQKRSGRQLVVVTLADLQGYDIADYGYRLGDHWGIGDRERDDGALLIVAPKERKVRIEVGYGLEGVLTDALSARIIRNDIVPHFRENDFAGGLTAGVDALAKLLSLPPDEARKLADQARRDGQASEDRQTMLFVLFVLLFVALPWIMRGRRRGRTGLAAPIILWGPGSGGWGRHDDDDPGGFGGFSGGGGSFGGGGASGGW